MPPDDENDTVALVLAAGSGTRFGGPKAWHEIDGKSMLEHAIELVSRHADRVVVGLPPEDLERVAKLSVGSEVEFRAGGSSRQETTARLLEGAAESVVLIHDVARPYADDDLVESVLRVARHTGAAAPVVDLEVRDSLARREGSLLGPPIDREGIVLIQTPYAFRRTLLEQALLRARTQGLTESSLTTLVRAVGSQVTAVDGDDSNVKVTYRRDLPT